MKEEQANEMASRSKEQGESPLERPEGRVSTAKQPSKEEGSDISSLQEHEELDEQKNAPSKGL